MKCTLVIQLFIHLFIVKRLVILFLLGVFTLTSTELIELTKLPSLLEHLAEHKAEKADLSLYEFLALHYSNDSHHHDEHDKKLPFKSHDHFVNTNVTYVLTKTFTNVELKPEFESIRKFIIPKTSSLTSTNLSSIWQPPKIS